MTSPAQGTVADHQRPGAAPSARPAFRPDIQGLRGIAVLLVVVCHAELALRGGFVGVDVFFVVSGFVIARELRAELETTGTVALGAFYARRARRLLPTLAVVVLVTLAVSMIVLNPFESLPTAVRTAAASSVFAGNAYLYRHVGYFDSWADGGNPFLHLWSLSVEEQFYLVLPLTLLAAWRVGRRAGRRSAAALVAVAGAASLWLSWAMTSGRSPVGLEAPERFAFYAPFTRAWELGVGVLLALVGARWRARSRWVGVALGLAGAGAIGLTAALLDPLAPFPGLAAVPPVIGAAALILAGGGEPLVGRALGWAPLRWVGDRSYSWYLWHWPAIVLTRALWPGGRWPPVAAAVAALGLAALGYRRFEDRIRKDRSLVGRRALPLAAACLVVPLLALGLASEAGEGGLGLRQPDGWYDLPEGRNVGCVIFNRDLANVWPESACTTPAPSGGGLVLLVGDRAADGVSTGLIDAARAQGLGVAEWARAGCPYVGRSPYGYPRCAHWRKRVAALVERLEPAVVVIANRSPEYVDHLGDETTIAAAGGGRPASRDEALRSWGAALGATLDGLGARGIPVVVVASTPDFGRQFPRAGQSVLRPSTDGPALGRRESDRRRRDVLAVEREVVADHPGAVLVDPLPALCGSRVCPTVRDGRWLYYEPQDLTQTGSRLLTPRLSAALAAVAG